MADAYSDWLVDSIRSGLIAIDDASRVVLINAEAKRILALEALPHRAEEGATSSGDRDRDLASVLGGQTELANQLRGALDGEERPGRVELTLDATGDSTPRTTIGYTLATIRDAGGAIRGAVIQFRDLTPFERRAAQDRLRERLAALGEMAAGLAHEIRNPLAAMEITAALLKRRLGDDQDAGQMLHDLRGEIGTIAAAVDASLEFVRPVALRREAVDAVVLFEACAKRARERTAYAGALEWDLPERSVPPLLLDEEGMRAVLVNLILNAFEALSDREAEGQRVVLRAALCAGRSGAGEELTLSVSDNGPGIPPDLRERIFYPFFTTKKEGSGVGLATAQKMVAEHGGRLELASGTACGACFRVVLPVERVEREI